MTRVSDRLLVQRVDDFLVLIDSSSGDEITLTPAERVRMLRAADQLWLDAEPQRISIDVVLGNAAMQTVTDVRAAVERALERRDFLASGDRIPVSDLNGNTVGEVVIR